jgi:hypothetical protein
MPTVSERSGGGGFSVDGIEERGRDQIERGAGLLRLRCLGCMLARFGGVETVGKSKVR